MNSMAKKYVMLGFIVCMVFILVGCGNFGCDQNALDLNKNYPPIAGYKYFWDFLVFPVAGLMWVLAQVFGQWYFLVIIFTTIIVRTIAWPIYAKSNDMSLKMKLIAPDQQKIEKRYEGKTDKESMQRKNAEVMQLYKKYKIGFGGCLTPLLQMPIFIAVFETLRRIPSSSMKYINEYNALHGAEDPRYLEITKMAIPFDQLKPEFLGLNLFEGIGEFKVDGVVQWQFIGVIIIAVLVGATQLLSQILTTRRQKRQQEKQLANVPEYRRPAKNDQQNQTELMMKIMLYGMPVMMVYFIIISPLALGLYWLIGNLYTTFQSYIGSLQSEKRLEKLRNKMTK